MFIGHFGVALAAKKVAPKTSLGTLILGAQFADLLWPILLLAGVEQVEIVPGITRVSPFDFTDYPISHSLLMLLVWSVVVGGIYYALRRYRRGALVIAAAVISHWILDFIVHSPDLPLRPGGELRLGLGTLEFLASVHRGRSFVFRRRALDLSELNSCPRQCWSLRFLVSDGLNFRRLDKLVNCRPPA